MSAEELVRACALSNDSAAWEEFVARFHRPVSLSIVRAAQKWDATPGQVVDDLVQETYLKLCADKCRSLLTFAVAHPEAVAGYVKTIALNVAHDHFKSLHSQKRGSGEAPQSIELAEPEARGTDAGTQEAMEREVLLKEINQYLEKCSEGPDRERDRLIFWLYYRQGMTAKDIAALPTVGLSSKGVESAIFRLTRLVREQVVAMESQRPSNSNSGGKGFLPAGSY
jgi:RNA polymerase sigma-70 factor (ECF subfamily)